jgi:hypothetical protein
MALRFSERIGAKPVRTEIQIDSMDNELRAALWNCLLVCCFEQYVGPSGVDLLADQLVRPSAHRHSALGNLQGLFRALWTDFYRRPLDTLPSDFQKALARVRGWFLESNTEWYEVYDLLEFVAQAASNPGSSSFINCCNEVLEKELSGYRFIGKQIVPITNETEIGEIEEALQSPQTTNLVGVHRHLESALSKLSDRKTPDYRNSIKESISAVEAAVGFIAGKRNAPFAAALKIIKDTMGLHPALEKGFLAIYGYTSDADGIRHAMLSESKCDFEDAKYMLVSCSAFVN